MLTEIQCPTLLLESTMRMPGAPPVPDPRRAATHSAERDARRARIGTLLARIEEMREHCMVFPTPKGGCHTLWVLGHLAYIETLVVRTFMLGEANPLAQWEEVFDGEDASGDIGEYPSFDDVLAKCREVHDSTLALLDSLREEDLDSVSANVAEGFQDTFGTYRLCLQYVADHWYMHRGHWPTRVGPLDYDECGCR